MLNNFFFLKSCLLWDNVEKCGRVRGATNDVTVLRVRVTCWISKATCTYAHAHARVPTHTHALARMHTQTSKSYYCFSRATMIRERASCYVTRAMTVWFPFCPFHISHFFFLTFFLLSYLLSPFILCILQSVSLYCYFISALYSFSCFFCS
jgi:hypothetical protein